MIGFEIEDAITGQKLSPDDFGSFPFKLFSSISPVLGASNTTGGGITGDVSPIFIPLAAFVKHRR